MSAPTVDLSSLKDQCVSALREVRRSRCQPDCACRKYQGEFCNGREKVWVASLDRLLEQIRRASF